MAETVRVGYARGVVPGKWAGIWRERYPRVPLELTMLRPVADAATQLSPLRAGSLDLAFIRLPGEAARLPDDVHLIPLYVERAVVLAARGSLIEAADEPTRAELAELAEGSRHPFDDDIEATVEFVAAGAGFAVVPQSIARLYARRDVVARPVADLPGWRIGLAWLRDRPALPLIDDFVGVVRGRTANSSRGSASEQRPAAAAPRPSKPARPSRAGRPRRRPTR